MSLSCADVRDAFLRGELPEGADLSNHLAECAECRELCADGAELGHALAELGGADGDSSLVLTESNYFERLEFESALDIKLRADMLGKCLLFIGYSLSDINIRYMLYKLHKLRHRVKRSLDHVPSAFLATFSAGEVQRTLLSQWDVSVIELDPVDKVKSTAEFLESLA